MKIPFIISVLVFTTLGLSAQIERKPVEIKKDSPAVLAATATYNKKSRREKLEELDLTREQKLKLVDLRQANQTAKTTIENNSNLSDQEKKKQLRDLQKEQAQKLMSILTEEQKAKYRANNSNNP